MAEPITASEALAHFENAYATEAEKTRAELPAIQELVLALGPSRPMREVQGSEIAEYVKDNTDQSAEQLEPLRAFLAYCSRLAFTEENLVPFLHLGPGAGGARGGEGANAELGGSAFFVTLDGLKTIEAQLAELKAQRPVIAEKLREAMADKDFRENAPLDAARDEQAHLEMRIRDLEEKLRNAVIMDQELKGGRANVGSVIRVLNVTSNREQTFTLVSPAEVDPGAGKISIQSPMGVAVMNHVEGDEVTVQAPSGPLVFRIVDVEG
jgi:transcription elongation factor GreA